MLIDARDEDGGSMEDQELLDEMLTLLLAGHETTATSLAWVFYHVLSHPDVLEKLVDELNAVIGGAEIAPEQMGKLEYLDLVIKESARLTPVATNVMRILKRPTRIGGLDLPAGVAVSAGIYATHHRPDLWPEPERFLPERFRGSRPSACAFFPFGGGLRRCIGAAFATYEMKVVLATVFRHAALRIAPRLPAASGAASRHHRAVTRNARDVGVAVQRLGGPLNLRVHFHTLGLDGVFGRQADHTLRFHPAAPPADPSSRAAAASRTSGASSDPPRPPHGPVLPGPRDPLTLGRRLEQHAGRRPRAHERREPVPGRADPTLQHDLRHRIEDTQLALPLMHVDPDVFHGWPR
jgi:hypothetical protein